MSLRSFKIILLFSSLVKTLPNLICLPYSELVSNELDNCALLALIVPFFNLSNSVPSKNLSWALILFDPGITLPYTSPKLSMLYVPSFTLSINLSLASGSSALASNSFVIKADSIGDLASVFNTLISYSLNPYVSFSVVSAVFILAKASA